MVRSEIIRPAMVFNFPKKEEAEGLGLPEWFEKLYMEIMHTLLVQEDLRFSRAVAISMLTEAWDFKKFREENPEADEGDRMYLICWLQYLTSRTGLLNHQEIKQIQESEGRDRPPISEEKPLLKFDEVVKMAQEATVVMRPEVVDGELYKRDYRELCISRLFVLQEDPALTDKKQRIESLGGELVITPQYFGDFHSTQLIETLQRRELLLKSAH